MRKVSVVIPVYNVQNYIEQCLNSLLAQTLSDIEIICVDDGSTDGTLELLRKYESENENIIVLQQENQFAGVARNNGLKVAQGKYVIFLDSDDFFEPDMLKEMYEKAEEENSDVCICTGRIFDEVTQTYKDAPHYLNVKVLPEHRPFASTDICDQIFNFVQPAPWTKLFNRQFIEHEEIEFQALQRTNDLCFVYVALACARRISVIEKCFVNYRTGNVNSLQATNAASPFDFFESLKGLKNELVRRKIYAKFEKSYKNRALDVCIYNLGRARTKEDFVVIGDELRKNIFYKLQLIGHTRGYFYHGNNFSKYMEVMEYSSEELWEKQHEKKITGLKDDIEEIIPAIPLIDIDNWENPVGLDLVSELNDVAISVIVPVYNVEKYLRECLDSVLAQTLKSIEIICVNDGSTDSSLEILKEYEEKDSRIKIVDKVNGGLSSARNAGMKVATGEYVYFLDSDDYLHLKALEFLYVEAKLKNLDQLFFSAESFLDEDANDEDLVPYKGYYNRKGDYSGVATGKELFMRMSENAEFKPSACLQINRKEFLDKYKLEFVKGLLHEDQIFTMQAMALSERAAYANANLYMRRIRKESIMTGTKEFQHSYAYFKVIKLFADFAEQYHLGEDEEYFNRAVKQLERLCSSSRNFALKVEKEILNAELWNGSIKEKDSLDYYFYIYNNMHLRKTISTRDSQLRQMSQRVKNLEEAKIVYEYKRRFQVEELKAQKDELEKKNKELETEKVKLCKEKETLRKEKKKLNKKIKDIYNSKTYKLGKIILFIPKKIISLWRKN